MRNTILVIVAVLALAGCGGKTPAAQTVPSATTSQRTAGEIATAMGMGKITVWTAVTDENHLLGRPGGYTSAATIMDKRISCTDPTDPGTDCGATVEVFATPDQALARSQYIQSLMGGIFGTEYHYLAGTALLRVTGTLTPDVAMQYDTKFEAATK
jgi:hypothetical protein